MKLNKVVAAFVFVAFLFFQASVSFGENWPRFRGPTGLGYTEERNLPIIWGGADKKNVLWESPLKGQGHASPIVWGDLVFVCVVHWPETVEDRKKVIPDHHVSCYRGSDGEMLWDTLVGPGPWLRTDFRSGPGGGYAAATPSTDGELLYCAFGSSVLAALDMEGKIVWRKEIMPYTFDVTLGSSPILYGDTVILFCAMSKKSDSRVVAFEKRSGEVKWETKLEETEFGHSTPVIISVKKKDQMLLAASGMREYEKALKSLDPTNGEVLWWCRGEGDASSPAYGGGLVYFDSGRGGPGIALDPTGSGDVSETHIRWRITQVGEALSSPIIVGKYLYRLHTPGIVKCWDVSTGKQLYSERVRDISTTWASPIADPEGHLFFANAGKSYVIKSGPKFEVLAVNDLGDGNHPSPAVSNGRMFLAGMKKLYCIGAKK
jgi:outer membrane protein assembly factor BamB